MVSFSGSGLTIDLIYPEEAHPNTTIAYDITITAITEVASINIDIFIYAKVNSTLQFVKNQPFIWSTLHENQSLPSSEIPILLPEQTNGTLYCNITVQTEIDSTLHYSAYSFYTTLVTEPTLSEMRVLYDEILANYTILQAEYETLLEDYDGLLANYSSLFADYTALLSEHDQLLSDYNSKAADYESLLAQYNELSDDFNDLDADYRSKITELANLETSYDDLNVSRYDLQESYNTLNTIYRGLNNTYTNLQTAFANLQDTLDVKQAELDIERIVMFIIVMTVAVLIAFIIYIKRKQEDPYLVIRKETVSIKSDEET
jgi:predicted nuclease with TOPRIM domain